MTEMKKRKCVIIDVMNNTGEVRIEAVGFTGNGCLAATEFIRDALGKTVSRELKPEHFIKDEEKTTLLRSFCG
jgi:hypothetical protein